MSTRSRIGIVNENGQIRSIYCHYSGDEVGQMLIKFYRTKEVVEKLIELGEIRSLRNTLEKTRRNSYHDYRGEEIYIIEHDNQSSLFENVIDSGIEYIYLYENSKWKGFRRSISGEFEDMRIEYTPTYAPTNEDYIKASEIGATDKFRWEDGIEHHPRSIRLVEFLAEHDFLDYDDHFCWKLGGDGDNGEILMYEIDAFFEMIDQTKSEF